MRKKIRIVLLVFLVSILLVLLFVKFNGKIYIDNSTYNYDGNIDVKLAIDDKVVWNDTLINSVFFPTKLEHKMRYGFHKINVSSKRAAITQEEYIFLLPNQFVYIEFLGADTLYTRRREFFDESGNFIEGGILISLDTVKRFIIREESEFLIETAFNPFRIQ